MYLYDARRKGPERCSGPFRYCEKGTVGVHVGIQRTFKSVRADVTGTISLDIVFSANGRHMMARGRTFYCGVIVAIATLYPAVTPAQNEMDDEARPMIAGCHDAIRNAGEHAAHHAVVEASGT
jgi:hypothetical protein